MSTSKVVRAAIAAKRDGYEYMTSIVKQHMSTTYHNVQLIEDIISAGGWIPCRQGWVGNWYGPKGVSTANLPEKSINKSFAIRRYCR